MSMIVIIQIVLLVIQTYCLYIGTKYNSNKYLNYSLYCCGGILTLGLIHAML
jgi:hypothetical protein